MSKNILIGGGIALVLVIGVIGFIVFRPTAAPSGPMTAVPLTAPTAEPAAATTEAVEPEDSAAPEQAEEPQEAPAPVGDAAIFELVPEESEARFLIDEVLRGDPITVVGVTSLVVGQIAVDAENPSASQVGIIQINARDLTTDNEFRNRAIRNNILETDRYELISFAPSAISGMPDQVAVGDSFDFMLDGELTIRDVTLPVSFAVTVTATSERELRGLATTSVLYRDFELRIPEVPSVDLVEDEVRLELEFVARSL
ncbi:YceI family protein [Candidatus Viridilinea mediisalina]|uniref:Lipid/polyisoprenoid-binding YceI-like domain-containing protein n=1 Tax=Candidatus Viridilinea mediisalina TaxID=2024553 RepID=A0A2A6RKQ5_9CHLR|nr:YceI family protein [Candidatus Viridilinea mediisalina]PDW03448.1 hypothetical protein CJ255_08580 [Candidatus Viridilinea mediisalina]